MKRLLLIPMLILNFACDGSKSTGGGKRSRTIRSENVSKTVSNTSATQESSERLLDELTDQYYDIDLLDNSPVNTYVQRIYVDVDTAEYNSKEMSILSVNNLEFTYTDSLLGNRSWNTDDHKILDFFTECESAARCLLSSAEIIFTDEEKSKVTSMEVFDDYGFKTKTILMSFDFPILANPLLGLNSLDYMAFATKEINGKIVKSYVVPQHGLELVEGQAISEALIVAKDPITINIP